MTKLTRRQTLKYAAATGTVAIFGGTLGAARPAQAATELTVVEWGDLVEQAVPAEHLVVRIEPGAADTERVLELTFHGPRWCGRQDAVEHALRDRAGR